MGRPCELRDSNTPSVIEAIGKGEFYQNVRCGACVSCPSDAMVPVRRLVPPRDFLSRRIVPAVGPSSEIEIQLIRDSGPDRIDGDDAVSDLYHTASHAWSRTAQYWFVFQGLQAEVAASDVHVVKL